MLFQCLNRTDAEKVFIICSNISNATITVNYPVVWAVASPGPNGVAVSKPASATITLVVGIADETIADDSYGRVQIYGYRASAYCTNDTSVAIAAGDCLICEDAVWTLTPLADDGANGLIYAAEAFATATTPAAANKKVFIRCM